MTEQIEPKPRLCRERWGTNCLVIVSKVHWCELERGHTARHRCYCGISHDVTHYDDE